MRPWIPASLLVLLAAAAAGPLGAQEWRDRLRADLVTVRDGKMVYEDHGIVKLTLPGYEPAQFQVKSSAEAPATGVISRDNFIAITTAFEATILLGVFAEAYQVPASQFMEGYDFTQLEAPIGTPDYEINLYMTAEGLQLEFVDTASGQRGRETMTWAEVHGR